MTTVAESQTLKIRQRFHPLVLMFQLGANPVVWRMCALSAGQLELEMKRRSRCDESVNFSYTAQLAVFDDFSTKREFLILLSLKGITKTVDIYNAVKQYFV